MASQKRNQLLQKELYIVYYIIIEQVTCRKINNKVQFLFPYFPYFYSVNIQSVIS